MPNVTDLNSYNFQENPFASIIQQKQQPLPSQAGQGMVNPNQTQVQAEAQGVKGQAEAAAQEENQLQRGVNPGRTKILLSAVQALEKFVTESNDREDIMLVRGVISAISRLINKDQETMVGQL